MDKKTHEILGKLISPTKIISHIPMSSVMCVTIICVCENYVLHSMLSE